MKLFNYREHYNTQTLFYIQEEILQPLGIVATKYNLIFKHNSYILLSLPHNWLDW